MEIYNDYFDEVEKIRKEFPVNDGPSDIIVIGDHVVNVTEGCARKAIKRYLKLTGSKEICEDCTDNRLWEGRLYKLKGSHLIRVRNDFHQRS